MKAGGQSAVRVVVVHPDLMGTYGDGGNGVVLLQRLRWRGIPAELVEAPSAGPLPVSGDVYCLGGGEDGPQSQSAAALARDGALELAVAEGAVVLAVCAGFQVLGRCFAGSDGLERPGLGILDAATRKGSGPRAVGEVVAEPVLAGVETLTGYENHSGHTSLGPAASPLGRVRSGTGNGSGDRAEGAVQGRAVGTYLHGPVLARNPALADLLLSWRVGPLPPLDDSEVGRLRSERLAAAGTAARSLGRPALSAARRRLHDRLRHRLR